MKKAKKMDQRTANPTDKKIGGRVRTRRLEIGMSQEQLAGALGVTFQQVQKYEKGVNRTASSRLFGIARVLGVNVSYFFDGLTPAGDAGEVDSEEVRPLARDEIRLLAEFRSLPKRLRPKVLALIQALKDETS